MKKITLLSFLLLTISFFSNAQIINGNFETWNSGVNGSYNYDSLRYWKTTDLYSLQNSGNTAHSAGPEVTDVYQGDTALKLTSWGVTTPIAVPGLPGAASNGDVNVVLFPPSITPIGGVPDAVPHAALMGYYKYTPVGSDSGTIETWLYKRNGATRDIVAHGKLKFGATLPVYTQFTVNITPILSVTPDSSLIWIESSPREPIGSGQTGSVLLVDTIYYSGQIGIDDVSPVVKSMITYPVPAVDELNVEVEVVSPTNMHYEIMDATGKILLTHNMGDNAEKINVSAIPSGNYFITLRDDSGKKLCAHTFSIVR